MNKIKVIDLLNMISKGKEAPNAIKFNDIIYKKADVGEDYYNFTISKWFFKDVFDASGVNLEVEILEEEKKIPEKILKDEFDDLTKEAKLWKLFYKYNNLIDYLKSKGE